MLEPDRFIAALEQRFDRQSVHAFRRFLRRHQGLTEWVLVSDYNLHQKDFPQDVIAFSLLPMPPDIAALAHEMAKVFPKDFKKSKRVDAKARGWFRRRASAFHWCVVIDKSWSVLETPGTNPLNIARESIQKTLTYLNGRIAPPWLVECQERLAQASGANSFPVKLYADLMLVSWIYAFIVGVLARERRIEHLEWCPDRDNIGEWQDRLVFSIALTNAMQWVAMKKRDVALGALAFRVIDASNARSFDPIIRPADLLAEPIASWNLRTPGSVREQEKYGDVLREILADNDNICVLRVRAEGWVVHLNQLHFKKRAP